MNPQPDRRMSRRTIAKGAAWALPAIAFAEAAPAATASTKNVCPVAVTGAGVKQVHGKTVTLRFTAMNAGAVAQAVTLVSISGPANAGWSAATPTNWQVGPGQSSQDVVCSRTNNANGTARVTLLVCGKNVTVGVAITK